MMTGLLWNALLMLVWASITGNFGPGNLLVGYVLGLLILFFTQRVAGSPFYAVKALRALRLAVYFLWELLKANLRVATDVITPLARMRPGVVAIPLTASSDTEITVLASLVGLTPGSLALDVSADRRTMFVHTMHLDDPDTVRREIKEGFERRLLAVTR
jgi:multicomponent Na+:H+ antiporter subunit E